MTAIDGVGDILFWAFPLFIPLLLIAHFRITSEEVVAINCLRSRYSAHYEKFGSPSARVAWTGFATLNTEEIEAFRFAAASDKMSTIAIDGYASAIRFRRILWLVLVIYWIAFMASGNISF